MTEPVLDEEGVPVAPVEPSFPQSTAPPAVDFPKRRPFLWVAVVAVVAALGFASLALVQSTRLSSERGDRSDVEEVSGRFAAALLTYDYADLAGAKRRVLALSTGNFRKDYEKAFDNGLETLFRETQARSAGTVKDVFVGQIEDGTVTTIAVVNAVAEGSAGGRRLIDSYIELQLVKVHGKWRVDGVTNLNLGAAADQPVVPAGTTTTTTAPPK